MRKYRNKPFVHDGVRWDSEQEFAWFQTLRLLEAARKIRKLERQVAYALHAHGPNGEKIKIGEIVLDAEWTDAETGDRIPADYKGWAGAETEAWRLRRRHFEAEYGRRIRVFSKAGEVEYDGRGRKSKPRKKKPARSTSRAALRRAA